MNKPNSGDDNQKRYVELEREQAADTNADSEQPEEQRLLEEQPALWKCRM